MIILCLLMNTSKEINGNRRECLHRNQINTREATKMRRARNHDNRSNNPAVMFAAGLEILVSDQLRNPSKYDDDELRAIQRSPKRQTVKSNLFSDLFKQLFWDRLA